MPINFPTNESRVLLVEGQDEKHVILHLCERSSSIAVKRIPNNEYGKLYIGSSLPFYLVEFPGGVSQFVNSIGLLSDSSGRQTIGFVMDANGDLMGRWNLIASQLGNRGINIPTSPSLAGTIIPTHKGKPQVGIWLMPDNKNTGEIEDFLVEMIPAKDPIWPLSNQYIEGIPETNRKFDPEKARKAKFYSWLASRKEPFRMGAAIGSGDLNDNTSLSNTFLTWIMDLFS